jgi:hypothetical protein
MYVTIAYVETEGIHVHNSYFYQKIVGKTKEECKLYLEGSLVKTKL